MTIIEQVRVFLRQNKWTIGDAGIAWGVSRSRASARLNGKSKLDVGEVEKLAEQAGKTVKIIFE